MVHMNGKIKKPNPKLVKQAIKGKSTIKTLKNLVNQYPIDKPWVSDEIRAVHDEKLDIENRLKGNKDDELFAQFKVQRDKFVSMYEAAREAYLKQEAASVMSKVKYILITRSLSLSRALLHSFPGLYTHFCIIHCDPILQSP